MVLSEDTGVLPIKTETTIMPNIVGVRMGLHRCTKKKR